MRLTPKTTPGPYHREPTDGIGYRLASFPTEHDCRKVGAR